MFKFLFVLTLAASSLPVALFAKYVPLKGANGQVVEFLIQSVEPEGIMAQHRSAYKYSLIRWEQLDLEWLKENHKEIWRKKQHVEAMQDVAYGPFKFGQSRNEVNQLVHTRKGVRVANEVFGDSDSSAMWITLQPQQLRQFLRFSFDASDQLVELQLHSNFEVAQSIETEMQAEWQRLLELVNSFGGEETESRSFPRGSEWSRWLEKMSTGKANHFITHRWGDARRQFELSLTSRQVFIGGGEMVITGRSAMGTAVSKSKSVTETKTNWVVLKSTLITKG